MPDLPTRDRPPVLTAGPSGDRTVAHGTATPATPADPAAGPPPPIPGYELLEEVGRGGMGVVYRARDLHLGRDVAVKLLQDQYPADGRAARRFGREARITGGLQHPGVPAVYRAGALPDGRPFLAMKLIQGRTLEDLIRAAGREGEAPAEPPSSPDPRLGGNLALPRANFVAAFEGVCQAVGYAHSRGIIHRDLKPANVMVGAFGEVQVMDWGLAKDLAGGDPPGDPPADDPVAAPSWPWDELAGVAEPTGSTVTGSVLGTPAFMPPEQARGETGAVDARSDVFGLGAVLCAVLTGRPPYHGDAAGAAHQLAARADLGDAFTRLGACGADPELVALCRRCLAPDPADRPGDGGEVAAEVAEYRAGVEARLRRAEVDAAGAAARAAEERKRRRLWVRAAAAVVLVFAAGAGAAAWQAARADAARGQAEVNEGRAVAALGQEQQARAEERRQRAEADRQRRTAATVNEFLQEVLAQSGPWGQFARSGTGNPNLTVREALDQAARRVDGRFRDDPAVEAEVRRTIGMAYAQLGAYLPAEAHLARAAELWRRALGPDHRTTLFTRLDLARVYTSRGKHVTAEETLAEVGRACDRLFGPDDPLALECEVRLGNLYMVSGRRDRVEPVMRSAVAAHRRVYGPKHPATLSAVTLLAEHYLSGERYAEAEPLIDEAVAAHREELGDRHPGTLRAVGHLGQLYRQTGRAGRAEPMLVEVVAGLGEVLGEAHPYTLTISYELALLYRERRRFAEAGPLLARVLAGHRAALGGGHPQTLSVADNLALVYLDLERWADAEPLLREVYAALDGAGHRDWSLFNVQAQLGVALLGRRKYAEAEAALRAGYEGMVKTAGTMPGRADGPSARGSFAVRRAAAALAGLYAATGRPAEAARWRARALGSPEPAPPPREAVPRPGG